MHIEMSQFCIIACKAMYGVLHNIDFGSPIQSSIPILGLVRSAGIDQIDLAVRMITDERVPLFLCVQ